MPGHQACWLRGGLQLPSYSRATTHLGTAQTWVSRGRLRGGGPSWPFSQVIATPPQCRASKGGWSGVGSGLYCLPPLGGLGEEGRARPVAKAVKGVLRYKRPSQGSLQSRQPLYPTLVRPEMKQGNFRPEFFSRRPFYTGNMKVPCSTLRQKLSW